MTLGGFGETSTIHWCSGPGNNGKSVVLPRCASSTGGYVTQEVLISAASSSNSPNLPGVRVDFGLVRNDICAVFEIAQADVKDRLKFKSMRDATPAPLVAALASLAWPPFSPAFSSGFRTQEECACAYALLREFGRVVPAYTMRMNHWKTESDIIVNGLVELFVLEGETAGQLSRDAQARGLPDVFVPPGVAEGQKRCTGTQYSRQFDSSIL